MNLPSDIRWQQRLANFRRAVVNLDRFMERPHLNDLEEQGLIQAFECAYELAWNTLRDYLMFQGFTDLVGSRDTFRAGFQTGLLADGQAWLAMLTDRNRTSHTYDQATASAISATIRAQYHGMLHDLITTLEQRQ